MALEGNSLRQGIPTGPVFPGGACGVWTSSLYLNAILLLRRSVVNCETCSFYAPGICGLSPAKGRGWRLTWFELFFSPPAGPNGAGQPFPDWYTTGSSLPDGGIRDGLAIFLRAQKKYFLRRAVRPSLRVCLPPFFLPCARPSVFADYRVLANGL